MKIKKPVAFLCLVALFAALFASCSKSDKKVLYFAIDSSAGTFDPTVADDSTAKMIIRNCFEGLVRTDENGNIVSGAAQSWNISSDGLTYIFNLRQNEKWHITTNALEELKGILPDDFSPVVTAYDFEFGLKRALDPAMNSPEAYKLKNIAGAKEVFDGKAGTEVLGIAALSQYVLEIKLSQPQSDFLYVLSEPACMPCNEEFFNACGGRYGLLIKNSLSNGPFYLSYFDDTAYRITKNPDYTGAAVPKADIIRFYVTSDTDTLYKTLEDGDYYGAYMNEAVFGGFSADKNTAVLSVEDKVYSFVLNPNAEALKNSDIRTAFVLATDTAAFAASQNKQVTFSPLPPALNCEKYDGKPSYDIKEASSLLEEALKKEEKNSVSVTLKCENGYEIPLKKQLQSWQKVFGTKFNIEVKAESRTALEKDIQNGNYDIAFYPVAAPSVTAEDFLYMFFDKPEFAKEEAPLPEDETSPAEIDSNSEAAEAEEAVFSLAFPESFSADNKADVQSVCDTLLKNALVLPVWTENSYFVCTQNVSGVQLAAGRDNIYFHNCIQ